MNRMVCITVVVFSMLVSLVGCNSGPSPKDVLSKYLENSFQANYATAYECLSSKDKAVKSQQEFTSDYGEFGGLAKAFAGKITFNIKEVKVNGEKALATVDVTAPDLSSLMGELVGATMQAAFNGGKVDGKDLDKLIAEKAKGRNLPTTTRTEQYDLVKDKEGWRVYMGWENEKKIKELKQAAERLEKQKKFAEAKTKYAEVQALSSRDAEAPKKVKELDEKITKYKEKQAYFPNIEVRNVKTGKTFLDEIGVFGELKNKGNRTLKKVEVTTYCLDKDGKVVFEKDFPAVLVSEHSYGFNDDKPLKPNYTQTFGYKLPDAPSDWSGKVRVEVTDLEFE